MENEIKIRKGKIEDLESLLDIYNYEVINGVSTLDLNPKTLEEREVWFYEHNKDNHPLFVAETEGKVIGYATLSSYREKEAYKSTVELSIYIDVKHRGKGAASKLMEFILEEARKDESIHNVVSVITSENEASERLHKKFGFTFCGIIPEVGEKFGRLLSISNYSLIV